MRKNSRINDQYLIDQGTKRKTADDTPGNSQNSTPALRDRVTLIEEILSLRTHNT